MATGVIIYSDVNQFDSHNEGLLKNVKAVYQSLENIFSTAREERFFRPEFGASLEDFLFEPIDDITTLMIQSFIIDAIAAWETRVVLDHALTKVTPIPEENRYDLLLVFEIIGIEGESFQLPGEIRR